MTSKRKKTIKKRGAWLEKHYLPNPCKGHLIIPLLKGCVSKHSEKQVTVPSTRTTLTNLHKIIPWKDKDGDWFNLLEFPEDVEEVCQMKQAKAAP